MRYVPLALVGLMVASCGSSSTKPTPVPTQKIIPAPTTMSFRSPPAFSINPKHHYTAVIQTTDGTFTVQLLPNIAPKTVNNFVFLARHNFYSNVIFHRIIQGFIVQTGDPQGTGLGGPGYQFPDELHKKMDYSVGTVAMANSGKDTNGSQFFIVAGPQGRTDLNPQPNYTIFGHVKSGLKVIFRIANTPVTYNPGSQENVPSKPLARVSVTRVAIHETR